MEYKGYTGIPSIDEESESLYGHVIGLRDVITFQGETFAELTQSFRDSVDEYLDFCESLGRSPEKPFSGRLLLRLPEELHRKLSNAAEARQVSLNSLIESFLEHATTAPEASGPARRSTDSTTVPRAGRPSWISSSTPPKVAGHRVAVKAKVALAAKVPGLIAPKRKSKARKSSAKGSK
jgi:predicted HicB family RNase H-like nuclease